MPWRRFGTASPRASDSTRWCRPACPDLSPGTDELALPVLRRTTAAKKEFGSIAAKIRPSLGYEGRNSFLRIVAVAGDDNRIPFGVELIGQCRLERLAQHAADGAEGARRAGGEFRGEGGGFAFHGI